MRKEGRILLCSSGLSSDFSSFPLFLSLYFFIKDDSFESVSCRMAFVSSLIVQSSWSTALIGRAISTSPALKPYIPVDPFVAQMSISNLQFQSYSGGIDRVSTDQHSITRYIFKTLPVTLVEQDKDVVITAGLRQVFGNSYLMEEERAELYTPESKYRCGEITAKEFVRSVAKSEAYRKRFFDSVSQYRFIELNFKHLLGRAPLDQMEYASHFNIFSKGGYDAEIDSYVDSEEYGEVFGDDLMPFTRFMGTYAPINQFNRMCTLEGGFAGSDKFKPQVLVSSLACNIPTPVFTVADGLPSIPNSEYPSKKYDLPFASLERFRNELEIAKANAYKLKVQLLGSYKKLDTIRSGMSPFKSMVDDIEVAPLYSGVYGNGAVNVFSGQYQGSPKGSWGVSGVENLNGPSRRLAYTVSVQEGQLERVKQLIVDLERRISVLESERDSPVCSADARYSQYENVLFTASSSTSDSPAVGEDTGRVSLPMDTSTISNDGVEDDENGMAAPRKVIVETKREFFDVGRIPKEIIEEIESEKKASGKGFLEGKGPKPSFPGDGSEMVVGG